MVSSVNNQPLSWSYFENFLILLLQINRISYEPIEKETCFSEFPMWMHSILQEILTVNRKLKSCKGEFNRKRKKINSPSSTNFTLQETIFLEQWKRFIYYKYFGSKLRYSQYAFFIEKRTANIYPEWKLFTNKLNLIHLVQFF